jgi:hypothetical protein
MTLSLATLCTECRNDECRILLTVMLDVIMLNVVVMSVVRAKQSYYLPCCPRQVQWQPLLAFYKLQCCTAGMSEIEFLTYPVLLK